VLQRHRSGQPGYAHIPLAHVLCASGEAYERSEHPDEALSRYSEKGALAGGGQDTYLAELRAGDILVRLGRKEEIPPKWADISPTEKNRVNKLW
jgi:hypothetical protein